MSAPTFIRARCPECCETHPAVPDHGRLVFADHVTTTVVAGHTLTTTCSGSGWLVEDDEIVSAA